MSLYLDEASLRRHISFMKDLGFNCIQRPVVVGASHGMECYNCMSTEQYFRVSDETGMMVLAYPDYITVSGGQWGDEATTAIDDLLVYVDRYRVRPLGDYPSMIAWSGFGSMPADGINYIPYRPTSTASSR